MACEHAKPQIRCENALALYAHVKRVLKAFGRWVSLLGTGKSYRKLTVYEIHKFFAEKPVDESFRLVEFDRNWPFFNTWELQYGIPKKLLSMGSPDHHWRYQI